MADQDRTSSTAIVTIALVVIVAILVLFVLFGRGGREQDSLLPDDVHIEIDQREQPAPPLPGTGENGQEQPAPPESEPAPQE